MAGAVSGQLDPVAAALVYCNTTGICQQLADLRRAAEWTEAALRPNSRDGTLPVPGDCRLHRAGIMVARGAWAEAEAQARGCCVRVSQRLAVLPTPA